MPRQKGGGRRTFADWQREDRAFQREIIAFQTQATFAALGIDPQVVADSWDSNEQKFTVSPLDLVNRSGLTVARVEPISQPDDEDGEAQATSPVQEMTGDELNRALLGAARVNNLDFLRAVRDGDTRVSVTTEAHRLIFKLLHDEKEGK